MGWMGSVMETEKGCHQLRLAGRNESDGASRHAVGTSLQAIRVRMYRLTGYRQAFGEPGSQMSAVKPVHKLGKVQGTLRTSTAVIGSI